MQTGGFLRARTKDMSNPPERHMQRWTPEEDDKLIREFHAGMTADEIARSHGRYKSAITSRLEHLRLVVKMGRVYYRLGPLFAEFKKGGE